MKPSSTRPVGAHPEASPPVGGMLTRELDFSGIRIAYDDRIIEPRPWTAAQSIWGRELLGHLPPGPVLEVCSGAGHIGLLAVRGLDRILKQVDIDSVACEYAARNAQRAGMSRQVSIHCGAMDRVLDLKETFALILADPPYLPTASIGMFPEDPQLAIDGGREGCDLIVVCLGVIARHLAAGGAAVLQVADLAQAAVVHRHLLEHPQLELTQVEVRDCGRGALNLLRRPSPP